MVNGSNIKESLVGKSFRAARKERSLTLAQVSELTGVSVSNLSKIENAQVSPSFDIIKKICDGLGIAIEDLVAENGAAQSATAPAASSSATVAPRQMLMQGRKTTTSLGGGVRFTSGQYDYIAHAADLFRKGMVPLEIHVRARSVDEFDHWSSHFGEEFVFVLSGELEIHTNIYAPFRLKAGESAYFDSDMEHIYLSVSETDAHIISVSFDPRQGQRPLSAFMSEDARPVQDER